MYIKISFIVLIKLANAATVIAAAANGNVSDAIINLDTCNLFDDVKAVLCNNSTFLTSNKCEINHNINLLEKYLNNPHNENILIITAYKLDNKKKIAKLIKEKCQIIDTLQFVLKFYKTSLFLPKMKSNTKFKNNSFI